LQVFFYFFVPEFLSFNLYQNTVILKFKTSPMKKIFLCSLLTALMISCKSNQKINATAEIQLVNITLDSWHKAAAEAKFELYFSLMTSDGVFIGTDPTENWQNKAFQTFSKPYFDKGKAWNFSSFQRNIYFSDDASVVWFDELLTTQMKICRGSGVLKKQNGSWKIAQYVLSMTIPNENTDEVVKIKSTFDEAFIEKLKK